MCNKHRFAMVLGSGRLSPFYRELIIYVGQSECYELGAEMLNKLLRTKTNATQVFRQTSAMGERACKLLEKETVPHCLQEEERVYVQVDGSMILTREEKWKETKLGRLFYETDLYEQTPKRGWIKDSDYVAHLGKHDEFEVKMSRLIDPHWDIQGRLVFVTDGAAWIGNWIRAEYPKATQILDFYHAMEYLGNFAKLYFKDDLQRDYWIEENRMRLKQQGVEAVIEQVQKLDYKTKKVEEERKKLLNYYRTNTYRMNYKEYLEKGLLIGSGAVEAAHRTLIQKRMKLSGQRWSKSGAQKMLDLRAIQMSGRWNEVVEVLRSAA